MSSFDGLMQEVNTKVKMLRTLAATDGTFRPCHASLIVGVDDCRAELRKTKIVKKFAKINHFLKLGKIRQ